MAQDADPPVDRVRVDDVVHAPEWGEPDGVETRRSAEEQPIEDHPDGDPERQAQAEPLGSLVHPCPPYVAERCEESCATLERLVDTWTLYSDSKLARRQPSTKMIRVPRCPGQPRSSDTAHAGLSRMLPPKHADVDAYFIDGRGVASFAG